MTHYLYWIHLPFHESLQEGYIGVSNNPKRRLREHKRSKQNPHLTRAFAKYKDNMTLTILLEGSDNYCLEIEEKLRPTNQMGWNIVKGGGKPPRSEEHTSELQSLR